MPGLRRQRALSHSISEGDGIAIIACVQHAGAARDAEAQGAKALAVTQAIDAIRSATSLPLLWIGGAPYGEADAVALRLEQVDQVDGPEPVVEVRDEEELFRVLERLDPELLLLAPDTDDGSGPLDTVLELLPDVPAGKLVIARVDLSTRDEVLALERAGIDAVLVGDGRIADLGGHEPFII